MIGALDGIIAVNYNNSIVYSSVSLIATLVDKETDQDVESTYADICKRYRICEKILQRKLFNRYDVEIRLITIEMINIFSPLFYKYYYGYARS